CQLLGQAEAREKLGRAESGDLFDPRGLEGEHDDGFRSEGGRLIVPEVTRDGRLAVRAGMEELPAFSERERPAAEESRDGVASLVPAWPRWHRHASVVGEHCDDGVDIVAFP